MAFHVRCTGPGVLPRFAHTDMQICPGSVVESCSWRPQLKGMDYGLTTAPARPAMQVRMPIWDGSNLAHPSAAAAARRSAVATRDHEVGAALAPGRLLRVGVAAGRGHVAAACAQGWITVNAHGC